MLLAFAVPLFNYRNVYRKMLLLISLLWIIPLALFIPVLVCLLLQKAVGPVRMPVLFPFIALFSVQALLLFAEIRKISSWPNFFCGTAHMGSNARIN